MANQFFRPLVGWVIRNRAEITRYGWPVFLFETFNWTFDHLAFPGGIARWGMLYGSLGITAVALLLNMIIFFAYDKMKVDWLQAKYLRDKSDDESKTQIEKILTSHRKVRRTWLEKARGVAEFIGYSAFIDPVILAVHYRESYFTGVSLRDWGILVAATLSACLIWAGAWDVAAYVIHVGHLLLDYLLATYW